MKTHLRTAFFAVSAFLVMWFVFPTNVDAVQIQPAQQHGIYSDLAPDDSCATCDSPAAVAGAYSAAGQDNAAPLSENCDRKKKKKSGAKKPKKSFLEKFAPILILLVVVGIVLIRLPKVQDLGHSDSFRRRRTSNWLPIGFMYAFLYMARYNIKVSQRAFGEMADASGNPLMANSDFGTIFAAGTVVYAISFLINGPLTDKYGGKLAILVGGAGSAVANLIMGMCTISLLNDTEGTGYVAQNFVWLFSLLYAVNMYFQSFGAVAIVKVNASWFHVRERGVFGAIFGILISLGVYFAYDWGAMILEAWGIEWVFLTPTILLAALWMLTAFWVKNTPGEAGHVDFDLGDASSGDDGPQLNAIAVFKKMLKNPVIMTIAGVEFCSGFLRQAIMQWYQTFAGQTDAVLGGKSGFVAQNWGMLLCCAGIMGGVVAGVISDRVFQSRRGPVAAILYGGMLICSIILLLTYETAIAGPLVIVMSMLVIGVHGMLSGTASMDFGGKKNVGVAVGIIDGFVYLGTAVMAITYSIALPEEKLDAACNLTGPATDPANWWPWPAAMIPFALLGLFFARKIWHSKPKPKAA